MAYGIFAVALLLGAFISWIATDWSWFSRTGAVATAGGFFATLRPKNAEFEPGYYWTNVYNEADDPVVIEHNADEEWQNVLRQQKNDRIRRNGVIMVFIATCVWGFGDLLGMLF